MYRIHWRSLITDATGQGAKTFPYDEANRIKNSLNEENKGLLVHWIELEQEAEEKKDDKSN